MTVPEYENAVKRGIRAASVAGARAPRSARDRCTGGRIGGCMAEGRSRNDAHAGGPRRASVSVAIAGSGGAGVMTAGNLLLEAAAHAGYYALMTRSNGPQIRGGEAAAMVRTSTHPIDGTDDWYDLLIALDWMNISRFAAEIPLGSASVLVGGSAQGEPPEVYIKKGARY